MAASSILIIDDNTALTEMWSLVLSEKHYRIETAARGSEALAKVRRHPYDLALIDINLPDMRGTTLLEEIKSVHPDTECVIVTAHSSLETAVEALNHGAYAYLVKPVEPSDLLTVIRRALERQELREENRRMMAEVQTAYRILHAVVNSIDAGVLLVGQNGEIHYANRRGVELLGLDEVPTPEDGISLLRGLAAAAGSERCRPPFPVPHPIPIGGPPGESEWEVYSPQHRVLRRHCVPVCWENGRIIGHVEVYSDVTRDKELLERHRRVAEILQSSILPEVPCSLAGLEIATLYHAAAHDAHVGGDFYDAFAVDRDRVAIAIGDVSGKGTTAAIQAALTRSALRAYAAEDPDPAAAVERLNRLLYAQSPPESFTTLFYGLIDCRNRVLSYCNAGHEPPLLRLPGHRDVLTLDAGGPVVGCMPAPAYACASVDWVPASVLFLYTDGATEVRRDGRFFELAGLQQLFRAHAHHAESATTLLDRVYSDLEWYARGDLRDDVALLAVRWPLPS